MLWSTDELEMCCTGMVELPSSCSAGELKPLVMPVTKEARQAVRAHLASIQTRSLLLPPSEEEEEEWVGEIDTSVLLVVP